MEEHKAGARLGNDRIYSFNDHYKARKVKLVMGQHYIVCGKYCRFIKVTRKGFNFLIEEENRCLLSRGVYSSSFWSREIPEGVTEFKVMLPACVSVYAVADVG